MVEFTEKVAGKVTLSYEVSYTEKDVEDILVGAIEGGINYWGMLTRAEPEWKEKPQEEPASTWAARMLLDGKTVQLIDVEDDTETFDLTLGKLMNGLVINARERPEDIDLEQADAITYDCIIQYALFGKLVYA